MDRWKRLFTERREEGAALVIAIILLTAMELLGFALTTLSEIDYSVTGNMLRSDQGLYAAETGVMLTIADIEETPDLYANLDGGTWLFSCQFRGKNQCSVVNTDPLPRFRVNIFNYGMGGNPGVPLTAGTMVYLYHINSIGIAAVGLERRIVVEAGILGKSYYQFHPGNKLAVTVAGY